MAIRGSNPLWSTKLTIKEGFKDKVDDLIVVVKAKARQLGVTAKIDRHDTRVFVTLIPNHPLRPSIRYCAWIAQDEIRWTIL